MMENPKTMKKPKTKKPTVFSLVAVRSKKLKRFLG